MLEPYSDYPGTARIDDLLDRGRFVGAVVDLLAAISDGNDSTVVSLVGPWGSGKTQILNEVRPLLRRHGIKVVNFSPWAAEDAAGLQAEFHSALLDAFDGLQRTKLKKTARKLAKKSIPLAAAIPYVGTAAKDFGSGFLTDKSWSSVFEEYGKEIKKASVKIVVVVDDLDRLQPSELLHVLKTIRLVGRLPRIQYLLAYDQSALVSTLVQGLHSSDLEASSFVEKIVQYPLSVPPAQEIHLRRILLSGIGHILRASPDDIASQADARFWDFYDRFMRRSLLTVRSVKRYAAQAQVYFNLLHREVDAADFLALTFIRLEHPKLYGKLQTWKTELLGQGVDMVASQKEINWPARLGELGYDVEEDVEFVQSMITDIFPAMTSGRSQAAWGAASASKPEYFDRYFVFAIPELDIADSLVERDFRRLIESNGPGIDRFSDTFDHQNEDVGRLAIKKAVRKSEASSNGTHHARIVDYLARAMAREEPARGSYNPRLHAQSEWLESSLKRHSTAKSSREWEDLARKFGDAAVAAARIVADLVSEFEGQSLPAELRRAVPTHVESFRAALIIVLSEKLQAFVKDHSYNRETREFLDLYGSLWRISHEQEFLDCGRELLAAGIPLLRVAGWFVYPGQEVADRFVFDEDGRSLQDLDTARLEMLIGRSDLTEAPLEPDQALTSSEEARKRQEKAAKGIRLWRKKHSP